MAMKKTRSKILEVAKFMPPLANSFQDIRNSEVLKWLVQQPEVLNYIWNNIKNSGSVVYNPITGKWKGVSYED